MFTRINILKIIFDHFKTLRELKSESKYISLNDAILFFAIPIVISSIVTIKGFSYENQLSNLIAGIAVFGGFLFNLLAIIYSQIENIEKYNSKNKEDENLFELKERFVTEIHINISFCIVLSIILILTLFLTTIDINFFGFGFIIKKIIIGLNYYLLIFFLLSLLMVINRVYILLKRKWASY